MHGSKKDHLLPAGLFFRRMARWAIAAALLLGTAAYIWVADPFNVRQEVNPAMASNVTVGIMPGKTLEEIQALLDAQTKKSEISFSINSNVMFANGWKGEGNFMIECLASNLNYLEFVITRNDTGEEIYRSGLMAPNQYILEAALTTNKKIPAGSYPCTATISSYDMETYEFIGKVLASINVTVKN